MHGACRWYQIWTQFILVWAVYSSFFTPLEFGFFRGLPKNLVFLDIAGQIAFLFDIVVHFLLAYRDSNTYRIVSNPSSIALRYVLITSMLIIFFNFFLCFILFFFLNVNWRKCFFLE